MWALGMWPFLLLFSSKSSPSRGGIGRLDVSSHVSFFGYAAVVVSLGESSVEVFWRRSPQLLPEQTTIAKIGCCGSEPGSWKMN
jgi:hypothetical protein